MQPATTTEKPEAAREHTKEAAEAVAAGRLESTAPEAAATTTRAAATAATTTSAATARTTETEPVAGLHWTSRAATRATGTRQCWTFKAPATETREVAAAAETGGTAALNRRRSDGSHRPASVQAAGQREKKKQPQPPHSSQERAREKAKAGTSTQAQERECTDVDSRQP
ncbi:MAG: hypothetical protein MI748_16010 [Opitutales bacterium]|nr:hypothetical protein [Opitutales bacterium]